MQWSAKVVVSPEPLTTLGLGPVSSPAGCERFYYLCNTLYGCCCSLLLKHSLHAPRFLIPFLGAPGQIPAPLGSPCWYIPGPPIGISFEVIGTEPFILVFMGHRLGLMQLGRSPNTTLQLSPERPTDSAQMCPRYPRRGGPDLGGCLAPSCWGLARAHASSPPSGSLGLSCILFLLLSLAFSFSLFLFPFLSSLPIPHLPSQIQTLFQWSLSFFFSQTFSLSQSLSLSLLLSLPQPPPHTHTMWCLPQWASLDKLTARWHVSRRK